MGRDIEQALSGVAVLVFIAAVGFIGVHCLMACKPAETGNLPRYCVDEALYTAALMRCVDKAQTLAESQMCRQQVDYSCGIRQTTRAQ